MVSFQALYILILATILFPGLQSSVEAFSLSPSCSMKAFSAKSLSRSRIVLRADNDVDEAAKKEATKVSLEEKMANWEASEEEIKAATLGGVVPKRADGFDIGLYVAFPFMVIGCLLFLAFPLIAGNIDTSSVGPPPTS